MTVEFPKDFKPTYMDTLTFYHSDEAREEAERKIKDVSIGGIGIELESEPIKVEQGKITVIGPIGPGKQYRGMSMATALKYIDDMTFFDTEGSPDLEELLSDEIFANIPAVIGETPSMSHIVLDSLAGLEDIPSAFSMRAVDSDAPRNRSERRAQEKKDRLKQKHQEKFFKNLEAQGKKTLQSYVINDVKAEYPIKGMTE